MGVKWLLALLLMIPQDCGDGCGQQEHPDRSDLDTGDLALALEKADECAFAAKREAAEWSSAYTDLIARHEKLVSENNLAQWELERVGRARALNALERVMLLRFMAPVDLWLENPHVAKEPLPLKLDGPHWYALVIEPQNPNLDTRIWIKFYLDLAETDVAHFGPGVIDDEGKAQIVAHYAKQRRRGLMDALEHHLVLIMDDPDCVDTIINGTPHLYRLATRDSDVAKLRKEDRIY